MRQRERVRVSLDGPKTPSLSTPTARPKSTPTYQVHKRSGRAFTVIDGRQVPLGKGNAPESRAAYDRVIGQWFSNGRTPPKEPTALVNGKPVGPTVAVLVDAFWRHAQTNYTQPARNAAGEPVVSPDGTPQLVPSDAACRAAGYEGTAPASAPESGLVLRSDTEYPLIDGKPASRKLTLAEYDAVAAVLGLPARGIAWPQTDDIDDIYHLTRTRSLSRLSGDAEFSRFVSTPQGQTGKGFAVVDAQVLN